MTVTNSIIYKVTRGAFLLMGAAILARGSVLISNIVIARQLGLEKFGEFNIVQNTLLMVAGISTLGTGLTAIKYISENRQRNPDKIGDILYFCYTFTGIFGAIASFLIFLLSSIISSYLGVGASVELLLKIGAFQILPISILAIQIGALSALNNFFGSVIVSSIIGGTMLLLIYPMIMLFGILGAVIVLSISNCLGCIIAHLLIKHECYKRNIKFKVSKHNPFNSSNIHLLLFSFPSAVSTMIIPIFSWVNYKILIGTENGIEEMGRFSAAEQIRVLILFLPGLLAKSIFPELSASKDKEVPLFTKSSRTVVNNYIYIQITLTCLPLFVLLLFPSITEKIFGNQFSGSEHIIAILALSCIPIAWVNAYSMVFAHLDNMWFDVLCNLLWAFCCAMLFIGVFYSFGSAGLAMSILISLGVKAIFMKSIAYYISK